jgi:hypothetical protein
MKNILGHDDDSEIFTVIARMRENKFSIVEITDSGILFEIKLTHRRTVPVPNTTYTKIIYLIERDNEFVFTLQQINGKDKRIILMVDGYIIWGLLEEKM